MAGMVRSAIRPILALALMLSLVGAEGALAKSEPRALVVVGAEPGKTGAAKRLVERLGGEVEQPLAIVHGFAARVPEGSIARLRRAAAIRTVARDAKLRLSSVDPVDYDAAVPSIDPPPAEIPTDQPADDVARDVISDAAEDAAAGSSLAPDPVASGEDRVSALDDAVTDPTAPVDPTADDGPARARASMDVVRAAAGADASGLTGAGVDVALIDS